MAKYKLIHLSDLHIGNSKKELKNTNKIVKSIGTSYKGVPVIITGDLAHSATKKQFKTVRSILNNLAKTNPILAVPGNHDYSWNGIVWRPKGWEHWVKYLGSTLGWGTDKKHWMGVENEPEGIDGLGVVKHKSCVYFGVDSGDPNGKVGCAKGLISTKLANALNDSLKKYEGKTRIVFLHHHPFEHEFLTALKGYKKLLKAVKNNCELLLFGHEHKYGIWWNHKGVPLIVSSHKSSLAMSGKCLIGTIIEINGAGTQNVSFSHRLEILK
jgi:predicted MPP superfamily phosphohydrolase